MRPARFIPVASSVNGVLGLGIHGAGAARTLMSPIQCGTAPVRAALGKQSPLSVILIRSREDGMIHSVRQSAGVRRWLADMEA
jgi:hypothetical protein